MSIAATVIWIVASICSGLLWVYAYDRWGGRAVAVVAAAGLCAILITKFHDVRRDLNACDEHGGTYVGRVCLVDVQP